MPSSHLYSLADCEKVLKNVTSTERAVPFLEPVPWKEMNLVDYPLIVKNPMDFGTISKKLDNGQYPTSKEFVDDMNLVFSNAKSYNQPGSEIYKTTEKVELDFKKQMAKIDPLPRNKSRSRRSSATTTTAPLQFSDADKRELGKNIATLNSKQLERVIQLIQKYQPNLVSDTATEIELDINTLATEFLSELHNHVLACTKKKKRSRDRDTLPPAKRRKISTTVAD